MVDRGSRKPRRTTKDRTAAIDDLRARLQGAKDPAVRQALEQALAALEVVPKEGGEEARPELVAGSRIVDALAAAGLTREHGELDLTENAQTVLKHRYLQRNDNREVIETPEEMFRRVARAIAEIDLLYMKPDHSTNGASSSKANGNGAHVETTPAEGMNATEEAFYQMMARLEFLPNSPTMMNAGTGAGTLSACFVLELEDSMEGIMDSAKQAAMVQKFGGGTGFALSNIRPKGAPIATTHGRACGPIAVLKHLSSVSTLVTQGGKRDGANMAVMDIHHPDILEFIVCKTQEGEIHNFNISVGVDEEFMQAVAQGTDFELRDPRDGTVVGKLDARDVFDQIVEGAWRNGEPGMVFLDQIHRDNPTPHLGRITATNPCGEQPLLPYESCNLGSINLARMLHITPEGANVDWVKLRRTIHLAVHFLDNVIDANRYSVPEIERMTKLTRKIGLGVMGFADMLVRLGILYDSEEGLEMGRRVMQFVKKESDAASVELAKERGAFPSFKGSLHDRPGGLRLRNSCRLTVAPTGTISMIAGCSSGIEPLFALAFRKHNILEGQTLYYTDAAFEAVARHEGFWSDELVEELSQGHSLKGCEGVQAWVKDVFVTAPDIAPEWHVRMQAAYQESTDAAISKTINFPNEATVEDVRTSYLLAWELGCKGITVYRAGSREKEVLTAGTQEGARGKKQEAEGLSYAPSGPYLVPRKRPQAVQGTTELVRTGHGNMYITINFDQEGKPFEVFANLGKAGGCDSANLEAVARLVSTALRSGVDPSEVISQLRGITCDPAWDSGVLVRSAPDAVSIALERAIGAERRGPFGVAQDLPYATQPALITREEVKEGVREPITGIEARGKAQEAEILLREGNGRAGWGTCPECSGTLVYQEGCLMCRECGYNKCG